MKSLLFLVCAFLFVGILAAGCSSPTPVPPPATTVPTTVPTPVPTVATTPPPLTDPALIGTWTYKGAMMASGGSGKIPTIPNTQSITLTFNSDGTLAGFSGCNNYNGGYTLSGITTDFGKGITIGPLASTKMYCADTADFETSYLNNIQQTQTYSITNNKMMLRNSYGNQLSYDKA